MSTSLQTYAFARLAVAHAIATRGCVSNPSHASTTRCGDKVVFENDSYRIQCGDDNEVLIQHKETGETYRVWGDPHVDIDGKHSFDFWGTTTFQLEDGTKVTIQTTESQSNPGETLASTVTITNGDYGVRIKGVDDNVKGDLTVREYIGDGNFLDQITCDGNVLHENPAGAGFLAIDDDGRLRKVDQDWIDATDWNKREDGADDALGEVVRQAFKNLVGLISISLIGSFLREVVHEATGQRDEREPRVDRPEPRPAIHLDGDARHEGGVWKLDGERGLLHVQVSLTVLRYGANMTAA